ncbi:MAG: sulfonate ABC transporter substrate-binding protein, partial [bacterium]
MLKQANIKKRARVLFSVVAAVGSLGACSGQVDAGVTSGGVSQKIRIGYFANVTHAAALVGV